jgi:hypothetical protein
MLQKLNKWVGEHPGGAWFCTLIIIVGVSYLIPVYGVELLMFFFLWVATIYICMAAAENQKRNTLLWAFLGAFSMPLPIIILSHFAYYKRLSDKKSSLESSG